MRGLLMIEPLYHQTVKGNKTQTRRSGGLERVNESPDEWEETGSSMVHTKDGIGVESVDFCNYKRTFENVTCKPRYKVGEVLYLKEPTSFEGVYKYDTTLEDRHLLHWNNKLFMPASAARAFVKITGISCERLLDISDDDCIAEGIEHYENEGWKNYYVKNNPITHLFDSPKKSFLSLFKFANKAKEVPNIWVWVYKFEYKT